MGKVSSEIAKFDITDKDLWKQLISKVSDVRTFLIGLVILVGSVGLLLGALTCALASVAIIYFGVELVPAMLIGFFGVGIVSLLAGVVIMKQGIPK